jgi:hypothetical protein
MKFMSSRAILQSALLPNRRESMPTFSQKQRPPLTSTWAGSTLARRETPRNAFRASRLPLASETSHVVSTRPSAHLNAKDEPAFGGPDASSLAAPSFASHLDFTRIPVHTLATPAGQPNASAALEDTASEVPAVVQDVLRSPGKPLDPANRSYFESRLGHDFSRVRVHTDGKAFESTRAVGALAYTAGNHVVLGSDQSLLGSARGTRLIAHEFTHVVQQGSVGDRSPTRIGRPGI